MKLKVFNYTMLALLFYLQQCNSDIQTKLPKLWATLKDCVVSYFEFYDINCCHSFVGKQLCD